MAERPKEIEFLAEVLAAIEGLPAGFADRLLELVAQNPADRGEAIRRLIEEHSGG